MVDRIALCIARLVTGEAVCSDHCTVISANIGNGADTVVAFKTNYRYTGARLMILLRLRV